MLTDALLNFWAPPPTGSPLSMVAAAGVPIVIAPGGVALDLLGAGVGVAPPSIIGTAALFGTDLGVGRGRPQLVVATSAGFATGNAATWNLAVQLAPDLGAGGGYLPGAWTTVMESGAQPVASAPANTVLRVFTWPPAFPATLRPRYARLLMQFPSGTNLNAGSLAYAIVTTDADEMTATRMAAKNYSVV